jgi:hypothetical protein
MKDAERKAIDELLYGTPGDGLELGKYLPGKSAIASAIESIPFRVPTFDVEGPRAEPGNDIEARAKTFAGKYKTRRERGKKRGNRLHRGRTGGVQPSET